MLLIKASNSTVKKCKLTMLRNVFSNIMPLNLSSFLDTRSMDTAPPRDCPYAISFVFFKSSSFDTNSNIV